MQRTPSLSLPLPPLLPSAVASEWCLRDAAERTGDREWEKLPPAASAAEDVPPPASTSSAFKQIVWTRSLPVGPLGLYHSGAPGMAPTWPPLASMALLWP